ncbi:MAG: phosphate acyltransferase PlsX [Clostridia bacterium]|nr:phosphate acyltransferase PlsX [Clostridia bacterium]
MKILVDAFGGDNSPSEVIIGSIEALNSKKGFEIEFVGEEKAIKEQLKGLKYEENRVSILNATEVITCEEEPTLAIRKKPESTINVAFKELKTNEEAKAFVSAGSTGAVLVGATLKLGRIKGVNRPALCPILPTIKEDKNVVLLDAGANADCKSINLTQFATMGVAVAKCLGVENPKVALLSNGTEDKKGNELNHEVFPLLKEMKEINFCGNCEARDILTGEYDVIVADGFSGNVALKSMEGAVKMVLKSLKEAIYSSLSGKIGGLLLKKKFAKLKDKLDYNKKGGALFVGVEKLVIKAHGSSKRDAFKNAVLQAATFTENDMVGKIKGQLEGALGNE